MAPASKQSNIVRRLRSGVSKEAPKRLSPAQNVKAGFSPKARRYALLKPDGTLPRITKSTFTVSANQFEKLRTGLTKAKATAARQAGLLQYKTAQAEQTAEKIRHIAEKKRRGIRRTIVRLDGTIETVKFTGHQLQALVKFRRAARQAMNSRESRALDTWAAKYPNGVVDIDDDRHFPIADFDDYENAWDSMSETTREEIDKRYEEEGV
jgi:hypothetical protein